MFLNVLLQLYFSNFVYHVKEWIPAAKGQLLIFKSNAEPYLQKISAKTFELYKESKSTIGPHIVKLQEVADPYFQVQFIIPYRLGSLFFLFFIFVFKFFF